MPRTCYLHIGTHKTGTTSLQALLAANRELLASTGIYVPRVGCPSPVSGHHNIAWELHADSRFDPRHGTLAQLLDELVSVRAPIVCISSEDFEYLHYRPDQLRPLAARLRAAGYDVKVVVFLRPQADYVESLYGTLAHFGLIVRFSEFLDAVLRDGVLLFRGWSFRFEYSVLLNAFAEVFGHDMVIVRPYRSGWPSDVLPRDFIRVVSAGSAGVHFEDLVKVGRLNPSPTVGAVVAMLRANVAAERGRVPATAALLDGRETELKPDNGDDRYHPLALSDSLRLIRRFWPDNRRVRAQYGLRLPCAEFRDVLDDVVSFLRIDTRAAGVVRKLWR